MVGYSRVGGYSPYGGSKVYNNYLFKHAEANLNVA